MTPSEIETASRRRYNAVNDTFFSQAEIFDLIYFAEQEMAQLDLIEGIDTSTTTVASTQSYAMPTSFIKIFRAKYNTTFLTKIDPSEEQILTMNISSTQTGTPQYWYFYRQRVYLVPTPDAAQTLELWGNKEATVPVVATTLEVPSLFHGAIVNFCVAEMHAKDKQHNMFDRYRDRFDKDLVRVQQYVRMRKRAGRMASVKDEEQLPYNSLGWL